MTVSTASARHLLVRFGEPARLPEALLGTMRDEVVLAGWVRASGVLTEVRLRAFDADLGGPGTERTIAGPIQALVIDGSIGLANGDVTCGLRAVLARETDSGLETIAGEIVDARIVVLEAMVTALDDIAAARSLHPSGVWMLDGGTGASVAPRAAAPAPAPKPAASPAPAPWADAVRASEEAPPAPKPAPKPSPTYQSSPIPPRPVKPTVEHEDQIYPEPGDVVQHFAFGRCEVIKSDGDRLHVRLGKDGRIKEIALDMLKVIPLAPEEGQTTRHFRLDRKL